MQRKDNKELFYKPHILYSDTCCRLRGAAHHEGRGPSASSGVPARAALLRSLCFTVMDVHKLTHLKA